MEQPISPPPTTATSARTVSKALSFTVEILFPKRRTLGVRGSAFPVESFSNCRRSSHGVAPAAGLAFAGRLELDAACYRLREFSGERRPCEKDRMGTLSRRRCLLYSGSRDEDD